VAEAATPLISVCQDATGGAHAPPALRSFEGGCLVELADGHAARFWREDRGWVLADARA